MRTLMFCFILFVTFIQIVSTVDYKKGKLHSSALQHNACLHIAKESMTIQTLQTPSFFRYKLKAF